MDAENGARTRGVAQLVVCPAPRPQACIKPGVVSAYNPNTLGVEVGKVIKELRARFGFMKLVSKEKK